MATSPEIEQRASYARALLERGIKNSSVATMVSARFGVSRSTAYKDLGTAHAEIDLCDDAPATDELDEHAAQSTIAQIQHLLDVASANNQFKDVAQLVRALDTAKKWTGTLQTTANPYA